MFFHPEAFFQVNQPFFTTGGVFLEIPWQVALPKLQSLTFGRAFHQTFKLPITLEYLICSGSFSQHLEMSLPDSLRSLTCSDSCYEKLEACEFPKKLEVLRLGACFNQPLKNLKEDFLRNLRSLAFGYMFNQNLVGVNWPPDLRSLAFGHRFNRAMQHVDLPKTLEYLSFGHNFNQSLEATILPSTLQHLQFGDMFNQPLDHMAFPNLSSLVFGDAFNQSLKNVGLPVLESMTLGLSFNQVIDWPEGLQSLSLGSVFEHTLDHLPETLRELSCRRIYQESLDGVELPSQLQSLRFGHSFDLSLDGVKLPSTLQHLEFGYGFNQPLDQVTFPTLKTLTFAGGFNQNLCNLPKTLRSLNLGHDFAKSFPVIRNLQRFECNGLRVAVEQEERLGCKFSRE